MQDLDPIQEVRQPEPADLSAVQTKKDPDVTIDPEEPCEKRDDILDGQYESRDLNKKQVAPVLSNKRSYAN